jgi:hypothetical protein
MDELSPDMTVEERDEVEFLFKEANCTPRERAVCLDCDIPEELTEENIRVIRHRAMIRLRHVAAAMVGTELLLWFALGLSLAVLGVVGGRLGGDKSCHARAVARCGSPTVAAQPRKAFSASGDKSCLALLNVKSCQARAESQSCRLLVWRGYNALQTNGMIAGANSLRGVKSCLALAGAKACHGTKSCRSSEALNVPRLVGPQAVATAVPRDKSCLALWSAKSCYAGICDKSCA